MSKPLRQTMPEVAAFIDAMREAFGDDAINPAIRAGMQGAPTFWASENGQEIGTRRAPEPGALTLDRIVIFPKDPIDANRNTRR